VRPGPRREAVRTAPRPVPHIPGASAGSHSRRRRAGPAGCSPPSRWRGSAPPPVVLERGRPVEERAGDVARFWRDGTLDPRANAQFGEGGAGTFSDGSSPPESGTRSWTTSSRRSRSSRDPGARQGREAARGTDRLRRFCRRMRAELASLGVPVRFGARSRSCRCRRGRFAGFAWPGARRSDPPLSCSRRATRRATRCGGSSRKASDVGEGVRRRVPGGASQAMIDPDPVRADGGKGLPPASFRLAARSPRAEGSSPSACAPAER